jgi:tetratricopeptide (TPR) repeat protein
MKTITFYSYKGGVGRTLTLSNIAMRLSELGKKVCLLDFDLEAPGLPFKFKDSKKDITNGIVDYIYEYSVNGKVPNEIKKFSITIEPLNSNFQPINLIPAGNIDESEYWKKLARIDWAEMFYSEKGQGLRFILDLKAKIEKEFSPDVLLVDSRTGITDISGITLKLLADEVVILSSYNDEGLFGSKKIIKSLIDSSNILFGKTPRINFILTRLPFRDEPADKFKENNLLGKVKEDLINDFKISNFEISVIHSDRRLEENERQLIGYEYEEKTVSISNDYLRLFDKLTNDILTEREVLLFKNIKNAEKEFIKSLNEKDPSKKLQFLDKAIELDSTKWEYLYERARFLCETNEHKNAITDLTKALKLNSKSAEIFIALAYCYAQIKDLEKAIEYGLESVKLSPHNLTALSNLASYFKQKGDNTNSMAFINQALEIDKTKDMLYNNRADLYRLMGRIDEAFNDIYKAIELKSNMPFSFATLAEIFASTGKIEKFYYNLNIALGLGLKAEDMRRAMDVYIKFLNEERFKNLLQKYGIDIDELI